MRSYMDVPRLAIVVRLCLVVAQGEGDLLYFTLFQMIHINMDPIYRH